MSVYGEIQSCRRNDEEVTEQGFTLIELLIVIVVLGILAAIVIFSLTGVTGLERRFAACNSDAKTVQAAVQAYIAQNDGSLPAAVTYASSAGCGRLRPGPGPTCTRGPARWNPAAYAITYTTPPRLATGARPVRPSNVSGRRR